MNKKQKRMLIRIIITAVLLVVLHFLYRFLGTENLAEDGAVIKESIVREPFWFILYLIPYIVIGFDILKKAGKGILNR